jgi:hypothetical protein
VKNSERTPGFYRSIFNLLPLLLTLATIVIGLWQYRKTSENETRRIFFNKQVESYDDIINSVALLVNNRITDKDSLSTLFVKFDQKTNGSYLLYTTDTVHFYIQTFKYYYERYIRNDSITRLNMDVICYKLANACRYSLNNTLGVDLKQIDFRKQIK